MTDAPRPMEGGRPTTRGARAAAEVTVVIPTHNRRQSLERAVRSVLAQAHAATDVVVVDDGSTDQTPDWLRDVTGPRLRTVRHETAAGPAAARNTGMAAARTPWVAFLDDDDLWAPSKLRAQLDAAESARADFVYGAALRVDAHLRPLSLLRPPPADDLLPRLVEHNVMPAGQSNVLVRRRLLERVGGFDTDLAMMADWDMWLRLAEQGVASATDEPVVAYVIHDGGMSQTRTDVVRSELRVMTRKHAALCRRIGRPLGGDDFWRWVVWGTRTAGRRRATARTYAYRAIRFRDPAEIARAAAALVGPPLMRYGADWAASLEAGADAPPWLDALRSGARVAPSDGTSPGRSEPWPAVDDPLDAP
jgi:glycosyltransferase involved in cell wall biosynthesis